MTESEKILSKWENRANITTNSIIKSKSRKEKRVNSTLLLIVKEVINDIKKLQ